MRPLNRLLSFLLIAFLHCACDTINNPIENATIPQPDTLDRAIVLEDFTGQLCSNCPDATKEALRLRDIYGERLILILPHVGHFATPNQDFPNNFRTPEGDQLNQFFGIDGVLPSGIVNRRRVNNAWKLNFLNWGPAVQSASQLKSPFIIRSTHTYDSGNRNIQLSATIDIIGQVPNMEHNIIIYVTEDSIVGRQLHKPPTGIVDDYVHNNMLRGSFNGAYGEILSPPPYAIGSSITKNWTYTLNDNWKYQNINLVILVAQNAGNNREIMQAKKVRLVPLSE